VLGAEHHDTLDTMSDLGELYVHEGRYGAAETIFTRILEVQRHRFGEDHPDTLTGMHHLASLYKLQGK
jgi:hypothetical protein